MNEIIKNIEMGIKQGKRNASIARQDGLCAGEIIKHIYDSEIHFSMGWMWDGGIDYRIGCCLFEMYVTEEEKKVKSTNLRDIDEAMRFIAGEVARQYPDSMFCKWWNGEVP